MDFLGAALGISKCLISLIWWSFIWNIRLQSRRYGPDTNLLQGHDVTLTFGSEPNIARDALSQYGDQYCEIVVKSDFK